MSQQTFERIQSFSPYIVRALLVALVGAYFFKVIW